MGAFFDVWDITADATPNTWWVVADAHTDPHWQALAAAAAQALDVFAARGRFDGDVEDPRANRYSSARAICRARMPALTNSSA